mgnify:CR=1 FL=1
MRKFPVSLLIIPLLVLSSSAQILPPDILIPISPPRIDLPDTNCVPVQVREMSVFASIRGLFSTVETTLSFHNPNSRPLEGDLVFPFPDGAAVCGYALDINGTLVDGVVVKKEKARVAFESETRRRVDPGIVEHVKGNLYRTRIFPLPPNGDRTIRLSYTMPLPTAPNGDAALQIPLPREAIEKLSVKIEVAIENSPAPELGGLGDLRFQEAENFWRVESVTNHTTPSSDIWVALPKLPSNLSAVESSPDGTTWFSISAVAPVFTSKTSAPPSIIHVLWDASGSRASADLRKEYDLLSALPAKTFNLVVFRDAPETAREFSSLADLVDTLKGIPFDGGSDFTALSDVVPNDGSPVLLFTDGIDTLSDKPMEFAGTKPMAIVSQTFADREALRQACAGALIDLQTTDINSALKEIANPSPRIVGIHGTGIANVQGLGRPAVGRTTLLGQLVSPETTVQIEYADGTLSSPFTLRADNARHGKILSTAWAAARINQLSPRADAFEDELLAIGRQYGLVSPATSLIVLESLDQWVRHEIEPPATLPEMREEYFAALKSRGQSDVDARSRHLQQLTDLWKQRVDWWKTNYSKQSLPSLSKVASTVLSPIRVSGMASPMAMRSLDAAPAPSPQVEAFAAAEESEPVAFMMDGAVGGMDADEPSPAAKSAGSTALPAAAIQIKEWSPDVPYLKPIRAATSDQRYSVYLAQRAEWSQSLAFFLDCADLLLKNSEKALGLRVLSNLAELKIEDAALLRVFAWRLRQAGELDRSIVLLRRVAKLRDEEPQSFRDLALALSERGQARHDAADLNEAMDLFLKVALTPWARHSDSIPLFALEELNALVAWINRQEWKDGNKPSIPDYDEKLRDNLDVDVRIVLSWDADATDIDLHVVEPGGEEAFYGHNQTARGGIVSRDVTDGYGPEEYLIHKAPHGSFAIKAKYYSSHQQTIVGPATLIATVFTHWGRPEANRQTLTLRLDDPKEMVDIGSIVFGDPKEVPPSPARFASLRPGMAHSGVLAAVGEPRSRETSQWLYTDGTRTLAVRFGPDGTLLRVVEILPGGIENIVIQ